MIPGGMRGSHTDQDKTALRAWHVCPHAGIVVVLRNNSPLYFHGIEDSSKGVPDYWKRGLKMYTAPFVLGDGTWWRWIKGLYGGKVPLRKRPAEEE